MKSEDSSLTSAIPAWLEYVNSVSLGSFNGASACACAARDALVFVDDVLAVLLSDSANGTLVYARAAADASFEIDLVSHDNYLQINSML